jgi:hypothetical protein
MFDGEKSKYTLIIFGIASVLFGIMAVFVHA